MLNEPDRIIQADKGAAVRSEEGTGLMTPYVPKEAPLTAFFNKVGKGVEGIGRDALHGAIAGGLIFMALGRGNMRVAFYAAVVGAMIGAGRRIYNNLNSDGPSPS